MGTLRGLSDMIGGGKSLDTTETWNRWPKDMPVLVYHGGEDAVCDPQAAKRFGEGAAATDKTFRIFHVGPISSECSVWSALMGKGDVSRGA